MTWTELSKYTPHTTNAIRYRVLKKGMSRRDACQLPNQSERAAERDRQFASLGVTYEEVKWYRRRRQSLGWLEAARIVSYRKKLKGVL